MAVCGDKDMAIWCVTWRDNLQVWLPRTHNYFASLSSGSKLNVQSSKNIRKPAELPNLCFLNFKTDFRTSNKIFEHPNFFFGLRFCSTSTTPANRPGATWSVLPPFATPEIAPGSAARWVSQSPPTRGQPTVRQYGIPPPSGGKATNSAAPCNAMRTTTGNMCFMAIACKMPIASPSPSCTWPGSTVSCAFDTASWGGPVGGAVT